jgi:hypothetical protein
MYVLLTYLVRIDPLARHHLLMILDCDQTLHLVPHQLGSRLPMSGPKQLRH